MILITNSAIAVLKFKTIYFHQKKQIFQHWQFVKRFVVLAEFLGNSKVEVDHEIKKIHEEIDKLQCSTDTVYVLSA